MGVWHLPEVQDLATWSFGIVVAQLSSLMRVAQTIADLNEEPYEWIRLSLLWAR